jgi:hypothetical protein
MSQEKYIGMDVHQATISVAVMDSKPPLLSYELPGGAATMTRQPVPDDQQLAGSMAQQVRKELDDLRTADRPGKQAEVEVPPRHPRHRRQHLPVEVILQHRRLSPGRPGAAAVRPCSIRFRR